MFICSTVSKRHAYIFIQKTVNNTGPHALCIDKDCTYHLLWLTKGTVGETELYHMIPKLNLAETWNPIELLALVSQAHANCQSLEIMVFLLTWSSPYS